MKISAKTGLKIAISLGLLAYFLNTAGIEKTLEELSAANLWYIPLGVAMYLVSQLVSAYRWQFLSRPLNFNLSLREFYDYYLIGMFFSLFLPGSIGGDVLRVYYLAKRCERKKREALLTLLAERGVGLVAVLIMTTVVCFVPETEPIPPSIRLTILGLSLAALLGFVLLNILPIRSLVQRFPFLNLLVQAEIYWKDIRLLIRSVAISFCVQGVMVATQCLVAQALGIKVPLLYLTAVYGITGLLSVIPLSFNGIGVREGAYTKLLALIGVPEETGLAFAIYWFLISSLTSLVGGLILLFGQYKTPSMESDPPDAIAETPPSKVLSAALNEEKTS